MKNSKMIYVVALAVSLGAQAMDVNFAQQLEKNFFGFKTIDPALLERVLKNVPEQATLWGCGLHQCQATLECSWAACKEEREAKIDFNSVGTYPLAVSANFKSEVLSPIVGLLNMFGIKLPIDSEGFFRVGAAPHEMVEYINDQLPKSFGSRATAVSQAQLSMEDFMGYVEADIGNNMPTIAYMVVDKANMRMHLWAIVGYLGDDLLVLETKGQGLNRLLVKDCAALVEEMNASNVVQLVKVIDLAGAMLQLRQKIVSSGGRVVDQAKLAQWDAYSLITFSK